MLPLGFEPEDLSLCAPSRCSLAGSVQHVQPMTTSLAKGDDKLDFTLIEDDEARISCCAMGINAQTDIIAEGHRIIGFLVQAVVALVQIIRRLCSLKQTVHW